MSWLGQRLAQSIGESEGDAGGDGLIPWFVSRDPVQAQAYLQGKAIGIQKRISRQIEREQRTSSLLQFHSDDYDVIEEQDFELDAVGTYMDNVDFQVARRLKSLIVAAKDDDGRSHIGFVGDASFRDTINSLPSSFYELELAFSCTSNLDITARDFEKDILEAIGGLKDQLSAARDRAAHVANLTRDRLFAVLYLTAFAYFVWAIDARWNIIMLAISAFLALISSNIACLLLGYFFITPPYRAILRRTAKAAAPMWQASSAAIRDKYRVTTYKQ